MEHLTENITITVRYNIQKDDLELFIQSIEPWIEKIDKEEPDNQVRRTLSILRAMSGEDWTNIGRAYGISRNNGYPKTRKQFGRDCIRLTAEGYLIARKKQNKWEFKSDDAKRIELEITKA